MGESRMLMGNSKASHRCLLNCECALLLPACCRSLLLPTQCTYPFLLSYITDPQIGTARSPARIYPDHITSAQAGLATRDPTPRLEWDKMDVCR